MPEAYTILWTGDYCRSLKKAGDAGKPISVLFGGEHLSAPSLRRFGVEPGDCVFPIMVQKGLLYVLAGVIVDRYIDLKDYAVEHLGIERSALVGLHDYQIKQLIVERCGELGHRMPYGCGTEVALTESSTPLRLDRVFPAELLSHIQFCPRRGKPVGLNHVKDGKITTSVSLQGCFRRLS